MLDLVGYALLGPSFLGKEIIMDILLNMLDACESSSVYIHLPQDAAAFTALRDRLQAIASGEYMELDELVNAYGSAATQEGFVNGWAWAQATAAEVIALRELPVIREDFGPEERCGNCRWFVQHYRYTGVHPWYAPVGCGHCMRPGKKGRGRYDPLHKGCDRWAPLPSEREPGEQATGEGKVFQ